MNVIPASEKQRAEIVSLLESEKLPAADLPAGLDHFFVATEGESVLGAIGLEQYDRCGLLRSMVVHQAYRNKRIASQLVAALERHAMLLGIDCIYLLTETAPGYFERKGYEKTSRDAVPEVMQASSEFSGVCPASAIVMKKVMVRQ